MQFIQARNYTPTGGREIDRIVLHDMEYPERPTGAEWCANYFARPDAPRASAHYMIDNDSVVQGVRDQDVAWAAPGANHNGLQIEHAGYARQTREEWLDAYGKAMLHLSALLVANLCKKHDIPIRYVTVAGLKNGERGITTHNNVSLAFRRSDHSDPGPNFPLDHFMNAVREAAAEKPLRTWPVPIPKWFWEWAKWRLQNRQGPRPASAPKIIPLWAWARLRALIDARSA